MGWYCRFPCGSLGRTPPLAEVRTVVLKQTPVPRKKHWRKSVLFTWWEGVDSNHRSRRRQIYSLMHLATLQPAHIKFLPRPQMWTGKIGAGDWNRTHNLLITNQLLCQLSYASKTQQKQWCLGVESNRRHTDFQSGALPTELPRRECRASSGRKKVWRPETGSNRRPPAWQAGALTNWAIGPNRVVGLHGLEPRTNRLWAGSSNQLS